MGVIVSFKQRAADFGHFLKQKAYIPVASGMAVGYGFTSFAEEVVAAPVTSADWESVITAMTGQISVTTVVGVLATAVSAGIGLVFMWWGVRKATRMLFKAFRSDRTSV